MLAAGGGAGAGIGSVGVIGSASAIPEEPNTKTPTVAAAYKQRSDFFTSIHLDPLIDVKEHAAGCREYQPPPWKHTFIILQFKLKVNLFC